MNAFNVISQLPEDKLPIPPAHLTQGLPPQVQPQAPIAQTAPPAMVQIPQEDYDFLVQTLHRMYGPQHQPAPQKTVGLAELTAIANMVLPWVSLITIVAVVSAAMNKPNQLAQDAMRQNAAMALVATKAAKRPNVCVTFFGQCPDDQKATAESPTVPVIEPVAPAPVAPADPYQWASHVSRQPIAMTDLPGQRSVVRNLNQGTLLGYLNSFADVGKDRYFKFKLSNGEIGWVNARAITTKQNYLGR